MSARYPLVRNLYAFATRAGVSRKPSRSGSSPSSASSFLISSCILIFYISTPSLPVRAAQDVATADALYRDRANIASARKAADLWAAELTRSSSPEETHRGVEARARRLLARGPCAGTRAPQVSGKRDGGGPEGDRAPAQSSGGALLAGRRYGNVR